MEKQDILQDKDNKVKTMNIKLMAGHFEAQEALNLLTQFIHLKIRFHEDKITQTSSEEDSKMREKRIRDLQKDLFEIRKEIKSSNGLIELSSEVKITIR